MSCAVLALAVRTKRFRSESSVGDIVADRETMVVVTCNLGATGERGELEMKTREGGEAIACWGGDADRERTGILSLPIEMDSGFVGVGEEMPTSTGIGARGGSFLCDCKNVGRRIGDLVEFGGDTCL